MTLCDLHHRSVDTRKKEDDSYNFQIAIVLPLVIWTSMGFVVGTFALFVVRQRANKAKHSQFVGGIDAAGFWLAAFLWDLLIFAVSSVLLVVVVLSFHVDAYSEWPVVGSVQIRVVHGSILCDPIQPNTSTD